MKLPTLLLITLLTHFANALPVSTEKATIKGTIQKVLWLDRMNYESEGNEGIMEYGSKPQTHYLVLKSPTTPQKVRSQMTGSLQLGLLKWPHRSVIDIVLKADELIVEIVGPQNHELTKGAKITLTNYYVTGDEWATSGKLEKLNINGKNSHLHPHALDSRKQLELHNKLRKEADVDINYSFNNTYDAEITIQDETLSFSESKAYFKYQPKKDLIFITFAKNTSSDNTTQHHVDLLKRYFEGLGYKRITIDQASGHGTPYFHLDHIVEQY